MRYFNDINLHLSEFMPSSLACFWNVISDVAFRDCSARIPMMVSLQINLNYLEIFIYWPQVLKTDVMWLVTNQTVRATIYMVLISQCWLNHMVFKLNSCFSVAPMASPWWSHGAAGSLTLCNGSEEWAFCSHYLFALFSSMSDCLILDRSHSRSFTGPFVIVSDSLSISTSLLASFHLYSRTGWVVSSGICIYI